MKFKKYYTDTDQLTSFPAMIQASGEPLVDYTIYGNTGGVGDRTDNMYNPADGAVNLYPDENGTIKAATGGATWSIILPVLPNTTYTVSTDYYSNYRRRVGMCTNYPQVNDSCELDISYDDTPTRRANTFTTTATTNYVIIMLISGNSSTDFVDSVLKRTTVQLGESTDFVSYYQIPVTSGGLTVNLPVTAPLGLTDTLTYTDTGIAIPTFDGDNTITFGTTIQPSGMSAEYKGWHSQDTVRVYNGSQWE